MFSPKRSFLAYAALCAGAMAAVGAVIWVAAPRFVPMFAVSASTPAPLSPAQLSPGALYAPADHARLMNIGTALQNKQPISDADLHFAIDLLRRGPVVNSPFTNGSFAIRTLSQLFNHQSLTPKQVHQLTEAVLPFADDPPAKERMPLDGVQASAISVQDTALLVLGPLNDQAAREKLELLARSSPTPKIRQTAAGLLARRKAGGWK